MLTLLDWTENLGKMGTGAHGKVGFAHTQKIELEKSMNFRFGNDETLKTRTMVILPVGIAGVNGVLRVHVVPGGAPFLSKAFLKKPRLPR